MAIIILYMTAHVYSSPRLLRHVYTPMTPLTLAWGWYSSGTLSSLFLYDALHEWADGDPTVADNCHSNRTFLIRLFLILRFLI